MVNSMWPGPFSSRKGGIFNTHSDNTAAEYRENGNESLGFAFFFFFVNLVLLMITIIFVLTQHQPCG